MRIRIVCHNNCFQWILGKFVNKLYENLKLLQIDVDIAETPDPTADINHYIPYNAYSCPKGGITTLMLTHIDNIDKFDIILSQSENASALICMSNETMVNLARLGVDKSKLCFVNPAHDGTMPIKKIVIGWSCRVQEDGRKREFFIDKLAQKLDPDYFCFKIMGDYWDLQVENLRNRGFEVEYHNAFIYEKYPHFISSLDYYLYMGMDEGQMGFIDALAAGVKTIVTLQGYHLDAPGGISHGFTTYAELEAIILKLQNEKKSLVNAVSTWNWKDYALKHIEIWEYLVDNKKNMGAFPDGLNSLLDSAQSEVEFDKSFSRRKIKELNRAKHKHNYYQKKRLIKETIDDQGYWGLIQKTLSKIKRALS